MALKTYAVRAVRSSKDPIFRRGDYRDFTQLLTGKRDLKSLYAHCSKTGAGVDEWTIDREGQRTYVALMDARRQQGLCFPYMGGPAVARLERGRFVDGEASFCRELDALLLTLAPSTALVWTGSTRIFAKVPDAAALAEHRAKARAEAKIAATKNAAAANKKATKKTPDAEPREGRASVVMEVTSAAHAKALTTVQRGQLTKGASNLYGKRTLASLLRAIEADGERLVLVRIDVEGKARWDGWLLGALEDGVFFDHGKTAPSGLVVSQTQVHDETRKRREGDVATITAALKTLGKKPGRKR
jgi:hypothetical protein